MPGDCERNKNRFEQIVCLDIRDAFLDAAPPLHTRNFLSSSPAASRRCLPSVCCAGSFYLAIERDF